MFKKYIYLLCLIFFKETLCSLPYDKLNQRNIYGDDYGTKWIFFPDGDGVPHWVSLEKFNYTDTIEFRMSMTYDVEFRLYLGNDTRTFIRLNEWAQPLNNYTDNTTYILALGDKPLKIITHGWKSSVDKEGVSDLKNAYLELGTVNVITIDWSAIADSIFYHWVANETKAIGAKVATFIEELHNQYKVNGKQLHLIGHSLGAHVMGIAAARSNLTVDRITGLDPARPLFEYPALDLEKLDPSDAEFVDVIHTCGGVLGFNTPTGTVDFYPNNGTPPQPGCESIQKIFEACSHGQSFRYFSESILIPSAFPAYQCPDWFGNYLKKRCNSYGYMGESVDRSMTGKYYLRTNACQPYGLGSLQFCTRNENEFSKAEQLFCSQLFPGLLEAEPLTE